MAIITLTTDLGTKDFYSAAVKGRLLSLIPNAQIIDISHEIEPFNIAHAALVLKNAFPFFPKNTIHIVGVEAIYQKQSEFVALQYQDQFFIGPNNSIFAFICETIPDKVVEIEVLQNLNLAHFPLLDVFVEAAALLVKNEMNLDAVGHPKADIFRKGFLQPTINQNAIIARVIYVDHYHNAITNVPRALFESTQKNRKFSIRVGRSETITRLSWDYNDVFVGDKLCMFGMTGYLEIALNRDKADKLLGLREGTNVFIDFLDE